MKQDWATKRAMKAVDKATCCDPGFDNGLLLSGVEVKELLVKHLRQERAAVRRTVKAIQRKPLNVAGMDHHERSAYQEACDDILARLEGRK